MCAFFYMSSQASAEHRRDRNLLRNFGVRSELAGVMYISGDPERTQACDNSSGNGDVESTRVMSGTETLQAPNPVSLARDGRMISRSIPEDNLSPQWLADTEKGDLERAASDAMRQMRWRYACEATEKHSDVRERLKRQEYNADDLRFREALALYPEMPQSVKQKFKRHGQPSRPKTVPESEGMVCASEELVVDRPRTGPGDDLIRQVEGLLMGMIL